MISDLLRILNQEYDISATALKPFGPVWQVFSAKGRYALKRTGATAERLVKTAEILVRIEQAGFLSVIPPEMSKAKLPFFEFNNHHYQLFQWRQGGHPSFKEPGSIQKSVRLFAGLHRISRLASNPEDCIVLDLIAGLEGKTAFLEKTISSLKNKPRLNRIDRGLIRWGDYYLTQARYSLSGFKYIGKSSSSSALTGFCHNDPAPRNIIVAKDQYFLIDFELSATGLLVTELAKLTDRILQANNWSASIFDLVINAYNQERPITHWEKTVLPYLLCFPQHFWRICSQRFEEKLKWSERRFAARFWEITNQERQRLFFLKTLMPEFQCEVNSIAVGR